MYHKKSLATLALVLLSLLVLPGGVIMAGNGEPVPHEDPDIAEVHYDEIAILDYYSQLIDTALARTPTNTEVLREKTLFANIPESLGLYLAKFGNATVRISWLIVEIEADIDTINALARQFRLEEMEEQRLQTQDKLNGAYEQLSIIEKSSATSAQILGIPYSPGDSPLGMAYKELEGKIALLRSLLDLFQALLETLPEDSLQELLQDIPEGSLQELLQTLLRPTELTLAVEPTAVFVGDWISFKGNLTSGGIALPNREVLLLLDGVPYFNSQTGQDGSYQGQLQIPYNYNPCLTLQALYYPQDSDIGIYLASKSSAVEIQALFYMAGLRLEIRGKSYPGLDCSLFGYFDYGDQPIPAARVIQIYLDRRLISQVSVKDSFELDIPLEPETALGQHRLLVIAPSQKRYAPVASETTLDVVKAVTTIEVSPPRLAFMPFSLNLEGYIYSDFGPVKDAIVEASFGTHIAQATTSQDGTFNVKLATGMNLSLIGTRDISLKINPTEPWNSTADSSWSLVLVNPILIFLIAAALAIIIVTLAKRLRVRSTITVTGAAVPVVVTPATASTEQSRTGITSLSIHRREVKDLRQLTFNLYRRLLRLIQDFTNITMKPHLTLREFTTQCAPIIGPAHRYLDQFTHIIERLLYSKHPPEPADLEKGQELTRYMEESLKHDHA